MNIRDLHYIVLVADHLNFRKAAEMAHVSQPTLSSQIKKLEDELGVVIFERDNRSVSLTRAGAAIADEARRILHHVGELKNIALSHKDPLGGECHLGVISSLSPYFTPNLMGRMAFDAPRLRLKIHEGLTAPLLEKLKDGKLDAVILATDVAGHDFVAEDLFDEPFLLALGEGHPLARRRKLTLQDIPAEDFLLLEEGHCLRDQTLELCRLARRKGGLNERVSATSLETLLRLVACGQGVTLVPQLAGAQASGLCLRKIDGAGAKRIIRLVSRKAFPQSVLLGLIAQNCKAIARDNGFN